VRGHVARRRLLHLHHPHGVVEARDGAVGNGAAHCGVVVALAEADALDRHVALAGLVRRIGNARALAPRLPGEAEAAALVVAGLARQAHAGRLLDVLAVLLDDALGKEAPAGALLARVNIAAAAGRHDARGALTREDAAAAVDAGLRRVQARRVKGNLLVPVDGVGHLGLIVRGVIITLEKPCSIFFRISVVRGRSLEGLLKSITRKNCLSAFFLFFFGFWGRSPRRVVHDLLGLGRGEDAAVGHGHHAAAARHARREEAVSLGRRRHAEGAVEVPLGPPAGLAGVEALARVRRHERARLGVAVHVRPALGARERRAHGRAALALGVRRPLALGRLLVAVEELARLVHLADVAVAALAARVEQLLALGVAEHARGLQREAALGRQGHLHAQPLGLLGRRHAGLVLGKGLLVEVAPQLLGLVNDRPVAVLGLADPEAAVHGLGRAAAAAGLVTVVAKDPEGAVGGRGGEADALVGGGHFVLFWALLGFGGLESWRSGGVCWQLGLYT